MTAGSLLWFSSTRPVTPGLWLADNKIWFDGELLMEASRASHSRAAQYRRHHGCRSRRRLAGASLASIAAAIRTFKAVEHRLEFVRKLDGVDYYNDSKATSVDATLKALDAFAGRLWIILGGKDKGLDYTVLRAPLAAKAHAALLIGAAAAKIGEELQGAVALENAGTLEGAVRYAYAHATLGDTVLLAPACASFDQFKSYEHRGQVFKEPGATTGVPQTNMAQKLKTDWTLFGTTIGMVAFGAVILYSASSVVAELKFGSSWHFVLRQACGWFRRCW